MLHAIFYMHQTIGMCAGVCACDRMHQMEKTATGKMFMLILILNIFNSLIPKNVISISQVTLYISDR